MVLHFRTKNFTFRIMVNDIDVMVASRVLFEYYVKRKDWIRGRRITWGIPYYSEGPRLGFEITRNQRTKGWALRGPVVRIR